MEKIKISQLQNGDIIAVQSKGFLPEGIQFFMKVYARKFYGIKLDKPLNHTMTVVNTRDIIRVAEAIKRGYVVRPVHEALHWDRYKSNPIVIRPKEPFTSVELYRLRKQYLNFAYRNIEYEITNFLWWMAYIVSRGQWDWSPKNTEKKLFCFLTSTLLWNYARPGFWANPSKTTTVDMVLSDKVDLFELE